MTREWGLLVLSCSIMVLAGSIVFGAVLKVPFNVGSIGQWASALGTVTAVVVALWNTNKTLDKTAERESLRQLKADDIYLEAIRSLIAAASVSINYLQQRLINEQFDDAKAKELALNCNLDGLAGAVDRIPVHTAPSRRAIVALVGIRTGIINTAHLVNTWAADTTQPLPDLSEEIALIEKVREAFEEWLAAGAP